MAHPERALSSGGRAALQTGNPNEVGQIYDHFTTEYQYPNNVRMISMCRQINGADGNMPGIGGVAEVLVGTKGTCEAHRYRINGKGIRMNEIKDGLSNTLLIGEKHVKIGEFGLARSNDCSIYDGLNFICSSRPAGTTFPLVNSINSDKWAFGSYHTGVCQFVFCDGSVRSVPNDIDPIILGLLANRADGKAIPAWE